MSQFQELLVEFSGQLAGLVSLVSRIEAEQREQRRELGDLRAQVVRLETENAHGDRIHDALEQRLRDGQRVFEQLQAATQAASSAAESAERKIRGLVEAAARTSERSWTVWQVVLSGAVGGIFTVAATLVLWMLTGRVG